LQCVKPRIIDTDVYFISENTTDVVNCVQSHNECVYEFRFQYVNSSVDEIEALRDPTCVVAQASFVRKL